MFYGLKDFFTVKLFLNFMFDLHQVTPFPTTYLSSLQVSTWKAGIGQLRK